MKKFLIILILFFVVILPVKASELPPSFLTKENIFEGRGSYFLCDSNHNLHNYQIIEEKLVSSQISGSCLIVTTLMESGYGYTILKNNISDIPYTINYQIMAGYFEIHQKDYESRGYFTQELYDLGGLTYEIYDKDNNLLETLSIRNGFKTIKSKLYMPGMYHIKQVKSFEGYEVQKEDIYISLNGVKEVGVAFFYNKQKPIEEIIPEDTNNDKPIEEDIDKKIIIDVPKEPVSSELSLNEITEDTIVHTDEIVNPYTYDKLTIYISLLIGSISIFLFIKKALY